MLSLESQPHSLTKRCSRSMCCSKVMLDNDDLTRVSTTLARRAKHRAIASFSFRANCGWDSGGSIVFVFVSQCGWDLSESITLETHIEREHHFRAKHRARASFSYVNVAGTRATLARTKSSKTMLRLKSQPQWLEKTMLSLDVLLQSDALARCFALK